MLPTSGGAIARILIVLACFILLAYIALGCLARLVRADDGVAPLPDEVVVRLESCKIAPGKAQPLFAGWSRVQADAPGAFASCSETYPIYPVTIQDDNTTRLLRPNRFRQRVMKDRVVVDLQRDLALKIKPRINRVTTFTQRLESRHTVAASFLANIRVRLDHLRPCNTAQVDNHIVFGVEPEMEDPRGFMM
jgi:hypothetical protein